MKQRLLLLFVLALPLAAYAQADLEGSWTLTFMMDENNAQTVNAQAEVVQDTLHLSMTSDHGPMAFENVSFNDDTLTFDFPSGHGSVACTLYRKDDESFSGICTGPRGEIPTTMKRPSEKAGSP